jgi:hypothetical protein
VPFFVAIWIAGMTVFQAPALAILRDVAAARDPVAPVVIATVVPAALWPWIEPVLARAGGSLTFLVGGAAVVAAATVLGRSVDVTPRDVDGAPAADVRPLVPFACGLGSAVAVLSATSLVPAALPVRADLGATIVAVTGALAALAIRGSAWSDAATMIVAGLVVTVLCRVVAPWAAGPLGVVVAVAAGIGVGCHLATALPFALSARPVGRAGLTSGLYVAGAAIGSVLVRTVMEIAA